ncbi:MAG: hypothetical protein OXP69_04300, partial [Spirochaetaceae bacterium]|nr:hypothetical protein [Spirochaetaceae bacterium]
CLFVCVDKKKIRIVHLFRAQLLIKMQQANIAINIVYAIRQNLQAIFASLPQKRRFIATIDAKCCSPETESHP